MREAHNEPLQLDHPGLLREQSYIDGAWVDAPDGACFEVTNPADGAVVARVPEMGVDGARRAIEAAHAAWPEWRSKTAKERAAVLRRWFDLMVQHKDDLAAIMTAEQGKPLAESAGEVMYGASFIEWFAEEGKRVYGDVIPPHLPDRRILTIKQGVGVVAMVTPWNFPNAMITRKAGPALAAGCPVVAKPASETPLSALALAALAGEAGIPAGVFNVVTTAVPERAGRALVDDDVAQRKKRVCVSGRGVARRVLVVVVVAVKEHRSTRFARPGRGWATRAALGELRLFLFVDDER